MPLLGDIYSYIDALKRKAKDTVSDPVNSLSQFVGNIGDQQNQNNALVNQSGFGLLGKPTVSVLAPQQGPSIGYGNQTAVTPQQQALARGLLADNATSQAMAGMASPSEYRGSHTAPMKGDSSAPLHDLAQIYPDDIYSNKAAQYYGHYGQNDPADLQAISLMQRAKGKPDMPVTMYRAVPDLTSGASKEIKALNQTLAYKDKFGFFPMKDELSTPFRAKYEGSGLTWDEIQAKAHQDMIDKVSSLQSSLDSPPPINNGDWVTLSRNYAKEHGESALDGKYKIISKKVPARKLFTDGNSIQEFGYDESGKVNPLLLGILGASGGAALADQDTRNKLLGLLQP
jgi:hypothetical protein